MMKKVWLVLLAVVLVFGLAMFGCSSGSSDDDDDGDDLVEKTVFDMATDEGIQALALGEIANTAFAGDANPIKPLVRAGENSHLKIEVVDNAGTKAIKFTTIADWGAGIDLRYAAFGLLAGDNIKIVGEFVSGSGRVQVNGQVGDESATIGGVDTRQTEIGPFDIEFTLQEKDITALKKGNPQGLRIEGRKDGIVAQINNITIKGKRPSNLTKLTAPVITASATGISWTEIENTSGYKVIVDDDAENAETLSDTGFDMGEFADGTYKISVTALGLKDATTDSDPAVVNVKKVSPPTTSVDVNLSGATSGGVGTVSAKTTTSYTYTYPASGADTNYGNGYAYFQKNLGTDKLANILEVKFTFKGGGTSEDGWKNVFLHASTAVFSGYLASSGAIAPKVETNYDGATEKEFTFTVDHTKTGALETESNLYFVIIAEMGNGGAYTISNVKFITGEPGAKVSYTIVP